MENFTEGALEMVNIFLVLIEILGIAFYIQLPIYKGLLMDFYIFEGILAALSQPDTVVMTCDGCRCWILIDISIEFCLYRCSYFW